MLCPSLSPSSSRVMGSAARQGVVLAVAGVALGCGLALGSGKLTGQVAAGYLEQVYRDPTLPKITGPIVEGSLLWTATALTSARLFATTTPLVIAPERFSRELLLNAEFLRQEREQQLGQSGQRDAVSATHLSK